MIVKGFRAAFLPGAKSEGRSLLKQSQLQAAAAAVGAAHHSPITDCASGRLCAKLRTLGVVYVDVEPERHPVLTPGILVDLWLCALLNEQQYS